MPTTIELLDGLELEPAGIDQAWVSAGWWVEGERVTVRTGTSTSVFRLPKGSKRVTIMKLGGGRSQLLLGGFGPPLVTVNGPNPAIERLREAVL